MKNHTSNVHTNISLLLYRDDAGRLVRTEMLRTKDITQRVKMKNYWQVNLNSLRCMVAKFFKVYCGYSVLVAYFHG